jgi:hypothetical protein
VRQAPQHDGHVRSRDHGKVSKFATGTPILPRLLVVNCGADGGSAGATNECHHYPARQLSVLGSATCHGTSELGRPMERVIRKWRVGLRFASSIGANDSCRRRLKHEGSGARSDVECLGGHKSDALSVKVIGPTAVGSGLRLRTSSPRHHEGLRRKFSYELARSMALEKLAARADLLEFSNPDSVLE